MGFFLVGSRDIRIEGRVFVVKIGRFEFFWVIFLVWRV